MLPAARAVHVLVRVATPVLGATEHPPTPTHNDMSSDELTLAVVAHLQSLQEVSEGWLDLLAADYSKP